MTTTIQHKHTHIPHTTATHHRQHHRQPHLVSYKAMEILRQHHLPVTHENIHLVSLLIANKTGIYDFVRLREVPLVEITAKQLKGPAGILTDSEAGRTQKLELRELARYIGDHADNKRQQPHPVFNSLDKKNGVVNLSKYQLSTLLELIRYLQGSMPVHLSTAQKPSPMATSPQTPLQAFPGIQTTPSAEQFFNNLLNPPLPPDFLASVLTPIAVPRIPQVVPPTNGPAIQNPPLAPTPATSRWLDYNTPIEPKVNKDGLYLVTAANQELPQYRLSEHKDYTLFNDDWLYTIREGDPYWCPWGNGKLSVSNPFCFFDQSSHDPITGWGDRIVLFFRKQYLKSHPDAVPHD